MRDKAAVPAVLRHAVLLPVIGSPTKWGHIYTLSRCIHIECL